MHRAIEDQAAEAVRDLALAELELPAGAEAVTSKLIPLLEWNRLSYDTVDDQVGLVPRRLTYLPAVPRVDFEWRWSLHAKANSL